LGRDGVVPLVQKPHKDMVHALHGCPDDSYWCWCGKASTGGLKRYECCKLGQKCQKSGSNCACV
jgi:hypothetical protein